MKSELPLSQDEVEAFRDRLAEQILVIHDAEETAVQSLQDATLQTRILFTKIIE